MIQIPQIELVSLGIGIVVGIALTIILNIIVGLIRRARKPQLAKMKELVKETGNLLQKANANQIQLYKVFNEIEEGLS